MPTYHQLQQKLQSEDDLIPFLTRKEIKELPRLMFKDEELETIVYGHYKGCNGILICTNARIIFADKGVHAFTTEAVELSKVSSHSKEMGEKFGSVSFVLPKKTVVFEYLDKKTYDKLTDWLKSKLSSPQNIANLSHETSNAADENPETSELMAKINKLTILRDNGIISEAEFQLQKRRLIAADLGTDDDDDDAF